MSNLVYPTLPGLKYETSRTPLFSTTVQEAVSGKETRVQRRQYPRIRFGLEYELLRDIGAASELRSLVGFFMNHGGRFDSFLFRDPNFNAVTAHQFGTGNGSATAFPLVARFENAGGPGRDELIQNPNGAPLIYVGGVLQTVGSNYTLGPTGIVTFTSPPGNGVALTWTGEFYYRCRFDSDAMTASEFMRQWWRTREVVLLSVKL